MSVKNPSFHGSMRPLGADRDLGIGATYHNLVQRNGNAWREPRGQPEAVRTLKRDIRQNTSMTVAWN
jgi:hypothetical protein